MSELPTVAAVDAAVSAAQAQALAESQQPQAGELDLFGDREDTARRRRARSNRLEAAHIVAHMSRQGVNPYAVSCRYMMLLVDRGQWEKANEVAMGLLPYCMPRLSVVALPGATPPGGGEVRFTWQAEQVAAP